ncbi:hypothetical protein TJA_00930 [Thermus sp. LT1-2-5]|uniref:type II toxin-antitoxin system HicA family toxin n=1 Tax=Thermus sp. LT1-2-5 TaxID=3026935 RepID=UPI0030EA07A7
MKGRLEALGSRLHSQMGSYVKFIRERPEGLQVVIVPAHKEIAVGTLRSILRQAGLTWEKFLSSRAPEPERQPYPPPPLSCPPP